MKQENKIFTAECPALTPEEERVFIRRGTERAFTVEYINNRESGRYVCRRCNTPLYRSVDKCDSKGKIFGEFTLTPSV